MRRTVHLVFCGLVWGGTAQAADVAADTPALSDSQAVTLYARRFDNAWLAANRGRKMTAPPYDSAAAGPAQKVHDEALGQCEEKQAGFADGRERMECFLAADDQFATAAKLDPVLVSAFVKAVRQATADADAGKLSQTQLDNVYFMITQTYASIIHDQDAIWRRSHPRPP